MLRLFIVNNLVDTLSDLWYKPPLKALDDRNRGGGHGIQEDRQELKFCGFSSFQVSGEEPQSQDDGEDKHFAVAENDMVIEYLEKAVQFIDQYLFTDKSTGLEGLSRFHNSTVPLEEVAITRLPSCENST